jgi:hypothetical protein
MVQKIDGITLFDFAIVNNRLIGPYNCLEFYSYIVLQQIKIGYNHHNINFLNVMVDDRTGAFKTLINWSFAQKRDFRDHQKYDEKMWLIFERQCKHFGINP